MLSHVLPVLSRKTKEAVEEKKGKLVFTEEYYNFIDSTFVLGKLKTPQKKQLKCLLRFVS